MYQIEIYNSEKSESVSRLSFDSKREANNFIKLNCEKLGYDFYDKSDRTLEYCKLY